MKISTEKSNKWIIETHKPLIPTIIFFKTSASDSKAVLKLISLKFTWWKWWWKVLIFY